MIFWDLLARICRQIGDHGPRVLSLIPWSKRRTRRRVLWPTRHVPAGPPARSVATVTGLCEQPPVIAPSSSTPAGFRKTRGQADLQTPRFGCHDKAPPDSSGGPEQNARLALAAIGQNLRGTVNRITRNHRQSHKTRPSKPLCPMQGQVRPADRTEWPNRSLQQTSRFTQRSFQLIGRAP